MKKILRCLTEILPFFAAKGIQYVFIIIISVIYSILVISKEYLEKGIKGLDDSDTLQKAFEKGMSEDIIF